MRWTEIAVSCPVETEEAVTERLRDYGCAGTASESRTEGDRTIFTVRGWLPANVGEHRLTALREALRALASFGLPAVESVAIREVDDTGWLDEWRKYHFPRPVGRRLRIVPSSDAIVGDSPRTDVVIEPGMAFGTGSHPTTLLTLQYVDRLVRRGMTVADVGTGSGILAIAAAALGASAVNASESDAMPRTIAERNVLANHLRDRVTVMDPVAFERACPPCDLVLCNIIAETIAQLAPLLSCILKPGGLIVCSGIVAERLSIVTRSLAAQGLELVEISSLEVWRTVLARKPRQPAYPK